jgi:hypothetical protein
MSILVDHTSECSMSRARDMLSKIKSFDVWVSDEQAT